MAFYGSFWLDELMVVCYCHNCIHDFEPGNGGAHLTELWHLCAEAYTAAEDRQMWPVVAAAKRLSCPELQNRLFQLK